MGRVGIRMASAEVGKRGRTTDGGRGPRWRRGRVSGGGGGGGGDGGESRGFKVERMMDTDHMSMEVDTEFEEDGSP